VAQKNRQHILIHVKVLPRSSMNQVVGKEDEVFKIKLKAAPVAGEANKSLVNFFSKKLGISKKDVVIVSGERSRQKLIRIYGLSEDDVGRRLNADG
jgi:uncharacterized protein (TIGR00251 family)